MTSMLRNATDFGTGRSLIRFRNPESGITKHRELKEFVEESAPDKMSYNDKICLICEKEFSSKRQLKIQEKNPSNVKFAVVDSIRKPV